MMAKLLTTENSRPTVAVAAIIRRGTDEMLMIQRKSAPSSGQWAFPGGKVQWHEDLVDAVAREVFEECGIEVMVGSLLYVAQIRGLGFHYIILDFAAEWVSGQIAPRSDADECQWMTLDRALTVCLADGMQPCLESSAVREYLNG